MKEEEHSAYLLFCCQAQVQKGYWEVHLNSILYLLIPIGQNLAKLKLEPSNLLDISSDVPTLFPYIPIHLQTTQSLNPGLFL